MKKVVFLFALIFCVVASFGQSLTPSEVVSLIKKNDPAAAVAKMDASAYQKVDNVRASHAYVWKGQYSNGEWTFSNKEEGNAILINDAYEWGLTYITRSANRFQALKKALAAQGFKLYFEDGMSDPDAYTYSYIYEKLEIMITLKKYNDGKFVLEY